MLNLVLECLEARIKSSAELHDMKIQYAEHFGVSPPANYELIRAYRALLSSGKILENKEFMMLIRMKRI